MMFSPSTLRSCLGAGLGAFLVLAATSGSMTAQAPATLPAFDVTHLDGTTAASATLVRPGPWMLVITLDRCPACDQALGQLSAVVTPAEAEHLVVVLSGQSREFAAVRAPRLAGLAAARWFVDPARAALPAFNLSAAPLLVGLRDDRLLWTRGSAGMTPAHLRALLTSWIR